MNQPPIDDPAVLAPGPVAGSAQDEDGGRCALCGRAAPSGASFCPHCGAPVTGAATDGRGVEAPADEAGNSGTDAEPEPDGGDEDDEAPAGPRPRTVLVAGAIVLVVAVLSAGAFFLGKRATSDDRRAAPTTTKPLDTADWVTHTDSQGGFSIRHPPHWPVSTAGDVSLGEQPLRLVLYAGDLNSVLVRVNEIERPAGPDNMADLKAATDALIDETKVLVLAQQGVKHRDMEGFVYLYTFRDPETNQEGSHQHYFLFRGTKMYTIVLQALPSSAFTRLEPTFGEVLDSFTGF